MSLTLTPLSPTLPGYVAYTPTWTSSGTAPAIGNSTVTARYTQTGKWVHCYGNITFGSSATFGTGTFLFALPVVAFTTAASLVGIVTLFDASANAYNVASGGLNSTSVFLCSYGGTYLGTIALAGQTTPWTWATSDQISWNLMYEAA